MLVSLSSPYFKYVATSSLISLFIYRTHLSVGYVGRSLEDLGSRLPGKYVTRGCCSNCVLLVDTFLIHVWQTKFVPFSL